jgi:predicted dehydrogenase
MPPITLLVIGGGGRGHAYSAIAAKMNGRARVVGVAEPRDFHRERMVREHAIPPANVFTDWRDAAARKKFADAVLICTQDAMHTEPAIAFAKLGYHMLLEKPMAPTAAECRRIVSAVKRAGILFGVCHVMRYTHYTQTLRHMLDAGAVGEVVTVQHIEPVAYWHQAHSFVRGSWRNEQESSFMLLAKSCHDIDWLRYMVGRPCRRVSSFGSLYHFRRECKPAGAADRCLECAVEADCPYSAKRDYFARFRKGHLGWPVNVVAPEPTEDTLRAALATGPYGRCVYACDNDVVDHQVVALEYDKSVSANFTMTAFTPSLGRHTRICGTRGYLEGDSYVIKHYDFLTGEWKTTDTRATEGSILGGHGGGDGGIMQAFITALETGDPKHILSGPDETLESHLTVFAAEKARLTGKVVEVKA